MPLQPNQTVELPVVLGAEEYLSAEVDVGDRVVDVRVVGEGGESLLTFEKSTGKTPLHFTPETAGTYRVTVTSRETARAGTASLRVKSRVTLKEKLALKPAEKEPGAYVSALRAALKREGAAAATRFWRDLAKQGAPLMEPIEGDPQHMRVTFFWKGNESTQNVALVVIPPWGFSSLADFQMTRIDSSDIWYRTRVVRKDARLLYDFAPNMPAALGEGDLWMLLSARRSDPFNPKFRPLLPLERAPSSYERFSILEMPNAPNQPWAEKSDSVPHGSVETVLFKSKLLGNERELTVYVPPGSAPIEGLLILFDREEYLRFVPTPTILDNLIAAKKIPRTAAVLISSPLGDTTRFEELTCNKAFSRFLKTEVLPWMQQKYRAPRDPTKVVVGGSSFGGLAAACAAVDHPRSFPNVLSQSGSFWWSEDEEPNRLARSFAKGVKLPLRFYLDAGIYEIDLTGQGNDILLANRHLRDVLTAKGYEVHYQEFAGGHDYLSWRGTLADGLIALVGSK